MAHIPPVRFAPLTPLYDLLVRLTMPERRFREALLRQANLSHGMRVLDVGCGTGSLLVLLVRYHPTLQAIGIDPDDTALRFARKKTVSQGLPLEFERASADALPFDQHSMDRVLSTLAFHHMPRVTKRAAFAECFRVLRPLGELHLADFGPPQGRLMRIAAFPIRLFDGVEWTADNIDGLLPQFMREAGFVDVTETGNFSTIFGTLMFYRAVKPRTPNDVE